MSPEEVAPGVWRWAARHPDWHPATEFGREVGSYAKHTGEGTVIVDPLLEPGGEARLDGVVQGLVTVLITIPYHARSAALVCERHGGEILGHAACAKRLPPGAPFRAVAPGDELPHGLEAFAIGSPPRQELPFLIPGPAPALAFGDAVVGVDGGLRVWIQRPLTEKREAWYRRRLVPTLAPLLDAGAEQVLVTHGAPVLRDGTAALRAALDAPPWYHRPD